MQSTINERLKILIDALGTNPNALARILGISASTLRNYTDRDSKPGYEVIEKLYHSFKHISLPWLFGEPGQPLLTGIAEDAAIHQTNKKISRSQVIGSVGGNAITTQNQGLGASEQAAMQRELELLRSQLADKERTIQILLGQRP
jgi:transcriptional regulator with XRE-family HTH domain